MESKPAGRNGCLTAWLVLMLVMNSLTVCTYLVRREHLNVSFPKAPWWMPYFFAAVCVLNVIFVISIFRWKKYGFYGICVVSLIAFAANLAIGIKLPFAMMGLMGPVILFGVLQIGGDEKGWNKLN